MNTKEQVAKIDTATAALRTAATVTVLPQARAALNALVDAMEVVREHCLDIENKPTPSRKKTTAKK